MEESVAKSWSATFHISERKEVQSVWPENIAVILTQ